MADRTHRIIKAADSHDLLSLEEAKLLMSIPVSSTTDDEQLKLFISIASQTVARLCNRIFAREELEETWREIGDRRIFLSHWPVKKADVVSVESPGGTILTSGYELEEASGKISIYGNGSYASGWREPVVCHYTGGYLLPDEAPMPLKSATYLLVTQQKLLSTLGPVAGLKQLSHKESRVVFHDPNTILQAVLGSQGGQTQAVMNILGHYIRYEV